MNPHSSSTRTGNSTSQPAELFLRDPYAPLPADLSSHQFAGWFKLFIERASVPARTDRSLSQNAHLIRRFQPISLEIMIGHVMRLADDPAPQFKTTMLEKVLKIAAAANFRGELLDGALKYLEQTIPLVSAHPQLPKIRTPWRELAVCALQHGLDRSAGLPEVMKSQEFIVKLGERFTFDPSAHVPDLMHANTVGAATSRLGARASELIQSGNLNQSGRFPPVPGK